MAERLGRSGTFCTRKKKSNALINGSEHWLIDILVRTESSIRPLIKESQLEMVMKDFVLILQLKKRSWSDG